MTIKFNPTISGGFVHHVMKSKNVAKEMESVGLSEETAHNLVKAVLIAGTRDIDIDIHKVIERRIDKELDKALEELDE